MRNRTFVLMLVLAIISISAYAIGNGNEVASAEVEIRYADDKPLERNPVPILEGNASLEEGDFKATIDSVLDEKVLAEKNGQVVLTEYMTYGEYVKFMGDEDVSTEIASDRVMFVVQVYYPQGFEHPRVGTIKNCLATGIYDAETGEYLGGVFQTVED